ncbi:MAG: GTP cyclohydrolase I FolE2 [Thermogemmatispora sp.]|jgi:GTP cyclohydrolase-4|uniref:GTP cyclohydrolase MptA n=1 Tax=Thermogemmatispora sp. TaxID=1968838 RepID=UPI001A0DCC40|nr:GTP cyclohydrolase MptA [Thermogemmatispora sp.]MBE3567259.1 GTP cyclohydrolase I FolE2 [Thermogemmatispora sp.]
MSLDLTASAGYSSNGKSPVKTHTVYLALGSNVGDRRANLAAALQRLREVVEISRVSSVYETEPVGYAEQPRFFNMVCAGRTALSAEQLLAYAKTIETALGRRPTVRNGPRPIDIDILLYDDLQMHEEHLTIPHPRMTERAFVLVPLAEIAPELIDPSSGRSISELRDALPQDGVKKLADNLRVPLEHDIQNSRPAVHVRLGRVGVAGLQKAILLGSDERAQWFQVVFDLYADLDPVRAGVHMSRFSEALEEALEEISLMVWPRVEVLAEQLARRIIERQQVLRAEVHLRTTYPLQKWTPISGRPTQEVYGLLAQAVATRKGARRLVGVEVEGMVACPCAQDMVHSLARVRLREEGFPDEAIEKMLDVTPLATHNQRGRALLMVGTQELIDAHELISIAENAMSSENYALLKRPDELYVVNKAHTNPRFVEDVVREMLRAIIERYEHLPPDTFVWASQRNEETIHKYDVVAEGWGTLAELRAEIREQASLEHHTTREEWLKSIE